MIPRAYLDEVENELRSLADDVARVRDRMGVENVGNWLTCLADRMVKLKNGYERRYVEHMIADPLPSPARI